MKPVAIFRSSRSEGPGHFATFLEEHSIAWNLIALDEGRPVPKDARAFSGMVFMGGPMSVNDDLPWIPPLLELIRSAVRKDVPTLGHCLGGQLMSKAFGGVVSAAPVKEIGWGAVRVEENTVARAWFGDLQEFVSFHWHGEMFSIPPGGTRVASSAHCANQGFAIGRHLGMQMHVEMTPEMVIEWCRGGAAEIAASQWSAGVQAPDEIEAGIESRIGDLHRVAGRIYERWIEGLARA